MSDAPEEAKKIIDIAVHVITLYALGTGALLLACIVIHLIGRMYQ